MALSAIWLQLDNIAPPPPVVIILFPLNDIALTNPKFPVGVFLYSLPNDSAASSTNGIFQFLQT